MRPKMKKKNISKTLRMVTKFGTKFCGSIASKMNLISEPITAQAFSTQKWRQKGNFEKK